MTSGQLSLGAPTFFVVWAQTLGNAAGDVMCRAYPAEGSLVPSGELRLVCSQLNGAAWPVRLVLPDSVVLRAPGENDRRQEKFDHLMHTQFAILCGQDPSLLKLPFLLSPAPSTVSQYRGVVTLDYREFLADPGYDGAEQDARSIDFITGWSTADSLMTDCQPYRLCVGDILPVFVQTGLESVFSVLELTKQVDDDKYQFRLTTQAPIAEGCRFCEVIRELHLRIVSTVTGHIEVKSFRRRLGDIQMEDL